MSGNIKEKRKIPRIVTAGTSSGCGKTTVTAALLCAFKKRGLSVGAFKCGPDYIDPLFAEAALGEKARNLDLFLEGDEAMRYFLAANAKGKDINIIEGVMGYYDGESFDSTSGSTFDIAKRTGSPAVLIVNAKGAALSVIAAIRGFAAKDSGIKGVILTRCGANAYEMLAPLIEKHLPDVRPLGYFPDLGDDTLESRHLGLVTAGEIKGIKEKLGRYGDIAEKCVDLDGIISLAESAPYFEVPELKIPRFDRKIRVGVACDRAFCFYYEDSLALLRQMGADIVYFSPLGDERLPEGIDGLYLGGGYPELYAKELSEKKEMLSGIGNDVKNGMPTIAECGGYMILTEEIDGHKMAGVFPGSCENKGHPVRFGYVTLRAEKDNLLCRKGDAMKAHCFHYYDCAVTGDDLSVFKKSGKSWKEGFLGETFYAGFPHLHLCGDIGAAERFYRACIAYGET